MSDNTSAVAYLRNQGGTKSLAMNDLATYICLWSEKRGMTLVPRYLPGHVNVLADHLSRKGSNPQDRVEPKPDRSRQVFSCLGQTIRGSVRPREEHEIGNIRLTHSGGASWKVDSLVQNWDGLYAYAYPPTSLIRACRDKVRTENVEIVLIAPGWPNQE